MAVANKRSGKEERPGLSKGQRSSLLWIYWAYVLCYLCRKNFPLLLPSLDRTGLLTTGQAGVVASVFEASVGLVKLFCGVFVDRHKDPAALLSQCLTVAGGSCLLMQATFWFIRGHSVSAVRVALVALFWSANGAGQAVAWPALARVFMNWFPDPRVRGFWYSVLSTNQNVGGTLAPRLFPPLMQAFGWASALYGPALLTLGFGGAQALSLQSAPPREVVNDVELEPPLELDSPPRSPSLTPTRSHSKEALSKLVLGGGDQQEAEAAPGSGLSTAERDLTHQLAASSAAAKAQHAASAQVHVPGLVETFVHLLKSKAFLCLCGGWLPPSNREVSIHSPWKYLNGLSFTVYISADVWLSVVKVCVLAAALQAATSL